jgi:hypothetical protein
MPETKPPYAEKNLRVFQPAQGKKTGKMPDGTRLGRNN